MKCRLKKPIHRLITAAIFTSFVTGIVAFTFEKEAGNREMQTFLDFLYFWISTITTVGAGINLPTTQEGQLFSVLTIVFGTFMYFAAFSEMVLWVRDKSDHRLKGINKFTGSNHVLIIGYNNVALGLINTLNRVLRPEIPIVLVTTSVENNPNFERVKFIKEHPANINALQKANVAEAKLAFILSNDEISSEKVDLNTILVAGMIEEINGDVFTIAEVLTPKDKKETEEFKIDETITFHQLLMDSRRTSKVPNFTQNLPKKLKQELFQEEYN